MAKKAKKTNSNGSRESLQKGFNPLPWSAGALLILALAVVAGIYRNRTATINEIRFSGNHFVESEQLQRRVETVKGIKPDSVDFMAIIEKIEQIPYVKWASIEMEPGGKLVVSITERRPIAMLTDGKEKIYVDADGIRLPMKTGKAVNVPIVYGFKAEAMDDTLATEPFLSVRDFLVSVRRKPVSDATISEVIWTREKGIVALSHAENVRLIFGFDNFDTRLENWEAFYGDIVRSKGLNRMKWIDLRFKNQIVTREI